MQPVATEDLAERIGTLLADGPSGHTELGGPEVFRFEELARQWQRARGTKRPGLPIRIPGKAGRELRAGAFTTSAKLAGIRTWRDYLAATY